jgi:hypothetical protein
MGRVYFDTEFTSLTANASIISIGLVNDLGDKTFYAELADNYSKEDCSEFCRMTVLPLLEHGHARMTLSELRIKLHAWLNACGPGAVLICDSPRDIIQLKYLFPAGPPCSYRVLGFIENMKRRLLNIGRRLHRKHGLRVHHALDDAKVNRMIFSHRGSEP